MHVQEVLRQESHLIFTESEKKVQLQGTILNQEEQKAVPVTFLLDFLHVLGLKSISFDRGLQREELHTFIKLLSNNPKAIHFEGGLPKLLNNNKISHIHADKKTYILSDQDQEISRVDINKDKTLESRVSSEKNSVSKSIEDTMNALSQTGGMDKGNESLSYREQTDMIKNSSEKLIEWLKTSTAESYDYEIICDDIQKFLQELIKKKFFTEVIPILFVFNDINTGTLKKGDKERAFSLEILQNLTSESNINIIFNELQTYDNNKKIEAIQIIAGLGDVIVNKLLDIIRDSNDSKERVRVIHFVEEIRHMAIPAIIERINLNTPWYFLRNLSYIIGHIGNETNADALQPLLLHKDKRVRMEAFKSIVQIGGNKKGSFLLSVLPMADQEFRINIIETLGKIRCAEAVPDLLDMLKSKSSMEKAKQISFQEIICNALGAIGSTEAIPALTEIAESKSFLGISSYPTEVKYAAKRALTSIQRKLEEKTKN
jgi:HEAT repeat protein